MFVAEIELVEITRRYVVKLRRSTMAEWWAEHGQYRFSRTLQRPVADEDES